MKKILIAMSLIATVFLSGCMYTNYKKSMHLKNDDGSVTESSIRVVDFSFSTFFNEVISSLIGLVTGDTEAVIDKVAIPDSNETPDATLPDVPTVVKPQSNETTVEVLGYHKRTNGSGDGSGNDPRDRPTWYSSNGKAFETYSSPMRIVIVGCLDRTIEHNGVRYDKDGLIVKESSEGRGLAVLFRNSCMSKTATIEY